MSILYGILGLKHSGKTTLGRLLSQKLELGWYDTDRLLEKWYLEKQNEKPQKYPVRAKNESFLPRLIYRTHGPENFSRFEAESLTDFLETCDDYSLVLSTGGAFVTNPRAVEVLKTRKSILLFLDTPEEVLFGRIEKKGIPPFIEASNLAESRKVWHTIYTSRRQVALEIADICISCGELEINEVYNRVLVALEEWNNGR
ncbi:MAG: hypothetical protein GW949_10245 [Spirochaetales bacterium]|nr:hypothetical protein [Spirochaetales bacterium]